MKALAFAVKLMLRMSRHGDLPAMHTNHTKNLRLLTSLIRDLPSPNWNKLEAGPPFTLPWLVVRFQMRPPKLTSGSVNSLSEALRLTTVLSPDLLQSSGMSQPKGSQWILTIATCGHP